MQIVCICFAYNAEIDEIYHVDGIEMKSGSFTEHIKYYLVSHTMPNFMNDENNNFCSEPHLKAVSLNRILPQMDVRDPFLLYRCDKES